jgi:hypothetical protein
MAGPSGNTPAVYAKATTPRAAGRGSCAGRVEGREQLRRSYRVSMRTLGSAATCASLKVPEDARVRAQPSRNESPAGSADAAAGARSARACDRPGRREGAAGTRPDLEQHRGGYVAVRVRPSRISSPDRQGGGTPEGPGQHARSPVSEASADRRRGAQSRR